MKSASVAERKPRSKPKGLLKVAKRIRERYEILMPRRRRHRILIWLAFFVVSSIIAIQLLYPPDRGLPFASVAGKSQFLATFSEMAKSISEKFDATKIRLNVGKDKSVEFDLKSAGAEPNTEMMIAKMSNYPLWLRFIPGSILVQPAQVTTADIYYSGRPLQEFSIARSKDFTFPYQNAHLAIKDGKVETSEAIYGSQITKETISKAISSSSISLGRSTAIEISATRLKPERTAKDLEKVRTQAESILGHTIELKADSESFTPSKSEIASWVVLSTNEHGDVALSIDKGKISAYLAEVNKKVGTPAGQTDITIVDGREVGRTSGAVGRSIDSGAISDQLAASLLAPTKTISLTAPFVESQPSVIFNSRYTATQAGLQAYVEDTARTKNMRIIIQQLDGGHWAAHARETESIPSASTFKVYLAKILFDKIDAGEIHWSDPILDTDVAGCFERMTVASTNPCAESWIAQWGREYINNYIYALGFSHGTSFTTGGAVQTTAADLNRYMTMLYNGTILTGANRDRLLDSLGRHPYRYGIPTGSAGVVHDKVGFLWDYVHDSAIVQHPRGTYIMTVMTKGQSYGAIAIVAREVERIMYP